MKSRVFLPALWTIVIVLAVVPWYGFQDHTHWGNVAWRPFVDPPWRVLDALLNVMLYAPLGALLARDYSLRTAILFSFFLSLGTEATQLFSHSRVPSMTDVTCNVIGAWIGSVWMLYRARRLARDTV